MVRINLLPVKVSKKKEAGKQQLVLFVVLLVAGITANWLYHSSRASDLAQREKRVADTKKDIADLDKTIGVVKTLTAEQADLKKKLELLDKLKAGRTGPVRMLDDLATITPKRLWLTKLEEKGGKVTLEGMGATIDDVSELMKKLKDSKYFADVELKKTEAKAVGNVKVVVFSLSAIAKYSPGIEATAEQGKPGAAKPKAGG